MQTIRRPGRWSDPTGEPSAGSGAGRPHERAWRILVSPAVLRLIFAAFAAAFGSNAATTFLPTDDSQVIARLRPSNATAAERELRALRQSVASNPSDLALSTDLARRLIAQSRREADPRYLGQAQTALAPWWTNAAPPVDVLVLRATIRQSLHDFPSALADLDAALAMDRRNAQAWLTKLTVHTVRGEYDAARRACVPLLRLGDSLTSTTAAAVVASLSGDAARSVELLESTLARSTHPDVATRVWALTQLAETNERLGRSAEADRHFQSALALAPRDPYLLGARADFLLDQHRPAEASTLLSGYRRMDGLLLRLAEAHAAIPSASAELKSEIDELGSRFRNAHARGDRVHLREEARFELRLLHRPEIALALARENWDVQKEPADVRLLLEAARASNDRPAETAALAWVAAHRLEDVRLASSR